MNRFIPWLLLLCPNGVLQADPQASPASLCGKLETVLQDPAMGVRLETRQDGFVLRMQSRNPDSQKAARAFAIEALKEHDLIVEVPRTNGYGLPEQ